MRFRLTLIGLSIAAALAVLLLALSSGRGPERKSQDPTMDPLALPRATTADGDDPGPLFTVDGGGAVRRKASSGRVMDFVYESFEPLADEMFEVTMPRVRLHLEKGRIMEFRANHGSLTAPDYKPREGTFSGDVELEMTEPGPSDPATEAATGRRRILQCEFDEDVHFERELGRLQTQAFVRMTSPQLDASGQGLRLILDAMQSRLNSMVGLNNGMLTLRRSAEERPTTRLQAATTEKDVDTAPSGTRAGASAKVSAMAGGKPANLYLATFRDRVVVRHAQVAIEADQLEVLFSFDGEGRARLSDLLSLRRGATTIDGPMPQPWRRGAAVPIHPGSGPARAALAHVVAAVLATSQQMPVAASQPSKAVPAESEDPAPGQTTIRWRGALTVDPVAPDDPMMNRLEGPDDLLVVLHGRPVYVAVGDEQTLWAPSIEYQLSSGLLRVTGSDEEKVVFHAPDEAVRIETVAIVIDQGRAVGTLQGPGTIRALHAGDLMHSIKGDQVRPQRADRLPAGTVVQWRDVVDLSFYKPRGSKADGDEIRIEALRQAVFRGQVRVQSEAFAMNTERLTVGLSEPGASGQDVSELLAEGGVRVEAAAQEAAVGGDGLLKVRCERLEVQLQRLADGQVLPTRLIARGADKPVWATAPEGQLTAATLEVQLQEQDIDTAPARAMGVVAVGEAAGPDEPALRPMPSLPDAVQEGGDARERLGARLAARIVWAQGDVRIRMPRQDALVYADRVVAEVTSQRIELFGSDEQPARAWRPDGSLVGQYMVYHKPSETLRVVGPGRGLFFEEPRPVLVRQRKGDPQARPAPLLDVAWQQSLDFDNRAGLAQCVGNVVVRTALETDTVHLTGHDLRVQLSPGTTAPGSGANGSEDPNAGILRQMQNSRRSLHSLSMSGSAKFLSEHWFDKPGGRLAGSVQIQGPVLRFDGRSEQVRVVGPGSMVFVDRRPSRQGGAANTLVKFSGVGNTLFEWTGDLTLDVRHNDVLMRQQVQMTHLPPGEQEAMILDCQRLLVDLRATGGMHSWMGKNVPRPDLMSVRADDGVHVQHGDRRMQTDHLKYTDSDGLVQLAADRGKFTYLMDGNRSFHAERMDWNLRTDRFEIVNIGAGRFAP
jgi:hypothetical protein